MNQAEPCVLRFFDPLDRFIEISRRRPEDLLPLLQTGTPDADSYRRAVLKTCIRGYKEGIQPHLEALDALNPLGLQEYEEDLMALVTEVNPELRLDKVQIPTTAPARKRPQGIKLDVARNLDEKLKVRLIGQDAAITAVSWALKKAAVGLRNPRRPWGSFFFVGSTGVGKTQLARLIAEEVFGGDDSLVRIDCSEYALPHEVAKLTGAPPGYVGFEQGGILTSAVEKLGSCVVLFDEVEKADGKLHNMLLQILDEGCLTDNAGKKVDFTQSLVILTGNVGVADLHARHRAPGFAHVRHTDILDALDVSSTIHEALRAHFSPEFLNRLDEVVVFRELGRTDACSIARSMLGELAARAAGQGVAVRFTDAMAHAVADKGFSPWNGAREIRRTIQRLVEAPLVEAILKGSVSEKSPATMDWSGDAPTLNTTQDS
ncbi:MAG: AAA family ATPase [Planctomycetota bacterium]